MSTLSSCRRALGMSVVGALFTLGCGEYRTAPPPSEEKSPSLLSASSTPDIIVNSTTDVADLGFGASVGNLPGPDGLVSLREAIIAANNTPGPQEIAFNIGIIGNDFDGTVFTIKPLSPLQHLLDDGTTIDGTTQVLFTGNTNPFGPEIVIDGSLAGVTPGIQIHQSDNHTIRGLVIHSFAQTGIQFNEDPTNTHPMNVQIAGCYIGTDETGSVAVGNGWQGIAEIGSNNLIGGPEPSDGNLISGNNTVLDLTEVGVGGSGTIVQRNLIGTDRTGTAALGTSVGIFIGGSNNVFGGVTQGARNVVSGMADAGVILTGNGNHVIGNLIGTDITGNNPLPNGGLGVQAVDATGSTIAGNLIAYNLSDGIVVGFTGSGNRITGNSIFANGGLGIDLGSGGVNDFHGDGVTSNDPGDSDIGPNNLMNFPVLTFAKATPGQLVVKGTIDTPNPKTVTLEFFANPVPTPGGDLSGHGEGAVFLGRVRPNGQGHFTASLPRVRRGTLISATATDAAGNTSEFSANIAAQRAAGDDDH